jgi:hypothetical protein
MNTSLLNDFLLNDENPTFEVLASAFDDIEFDGYSLQSADVIAQDIVVYSPPSRELITYKVPRNDGGRLNGNYYRERRIRVNGIIKAASRVLLEETMDTFKRRMHTPEGNLDLKVNGEIRRITATLQNSGEMFNERKGYHINITPFSLEFLALDPFFHDTDYTASTSENITNLNFPITVENLGTIYARPVITIIFEAATSVTAFTFNNVTNGKTMLITRAFSALDILVIDTEESTVTVNGVEVDYDGLFPTLDYGSNNCTLVTTGSSVQYTSTISFKRSYL